MDAKELNGLPLPIAIWLQNDSYDYANNPLAFSATELLKPTKQVILSRRAKESGETNCELEDYFFSVRGSAIHESIETAVMNALNQPNDLGEYLSKLDIRMEQRSQKEFKGVIITGKYDMVINGHLFDFKNTSVFSYKTEARREEFRQQMSIYKWLNPDVITGNTFTICYILQDWKNANREEVPTPVPHKEYEFLSEAETEEFLSARIDALVNNYSLDEEAIARCPDSELWLTPIIYKYYASLTSTRSSKNFTDLAEANAYAKAKGKGTLLKTGGEALRCKYCEGKALCTTIPRTNIHEPTKI